jgi:NAD(P)-dependent dehydrogenase (short-subunit alcohol dehydrogenase family)
MHGRLRKASTGIGSGATKAVSSAGYRVIATVRAAEDAGRLPRARRTAPALCRPTCAKFVPFERRDQLIHFEYLADGLSA